MSFPLEPDDLYRKRTLQEDLDSQKQAIQDALSCPVIGRYLDGIRAMTLGVPSHLVGPSLTPRSAQHIMKDTLMDLVQPATVKVSSEQGEDDTIIAHCEIHKKAEERIVLNVSIKGPKPPTDPVVLAASESEVKEKALYCAEHGILITFTETGGTSFSGYGLHDELATDVLWLWEDRIVPLLKTDPAFAAQYRATYERFGDRY